MDKNQNQRLFQLGKKIAIWVIRSQVLGIESHPSVTSDDLSELIDGVSAILRMEPAFIELESEHVVVGDIHGNIGDLMRIFETCGYPPNRSYLFLGDYVDRGQNSCEVILLLYALKTMWPNHLTLLRGNHEFASMNHVYGFKRECVSRLSKELFLQITASFEELPLAARLFNNFCVHGGISPKLRSLSDLRAMTKGCTSFGDNLPTDLLWSDPSIEVEEFEKSSRGCGNLFGANAVITFAKETGICDRVIRAHEMCSAGYDFPLDMGLVLTLFSSSDYCEMMNDGGFAIVKDNGDPEIHQLFPLAPKQRQKRKITYPEWAMDSLTAMIVPPIDDMIHGLNITIDV
jgi:diadenosine tetraphosphatase ApaH/serine/threonine PP2A family protein phosphatase